MNNKILFAGGLVLLYLLLRKKTTPIPVAPTLVPQTFDLLNNAIVTQGSPNESGYTLTVKSSKPIQASYVPNSKNGAFLKVNVTNLLTVNDYIPTFDKINGIKKTLKLVC
jgi:hypothetical protein